MQLLDMVSPLFLAIPIFLLIAISALVILAIIWLVKYLKKRKQNNI